MDKFKGAIVHPQSWPEDLELRGQEGRGDRLRRDGRDANSGDRRQLRPRHHAAALADLFQHRPQRHRARRDAAAAAGQGGMDPRDRAPQDPVRAGSVHPPLVHRAREGQAGAAGRHSRLSRSRIRASSRSTSRRATGRGGSASPSCPTATCSGGQSGKASVVTDEIDRFTENGHPAEVRQGARGRHHRHRDRLQPERAGRHRVRDRRQAARLRRHRHLSRHDVHRRAQHGVGVRLLPRELDAARRSGRRLRVPPAEAHEEEAARRRWRRRCGPRTRTCRCCRGSTRRTSIPAT